MVGVVGEKADYLGDSPSSPLVSDLLERWQMDQGVSSKGHFEVGDSRI